MNDKELKDVINRYIREICHISNMQVFSTSNYQRRFFQTRINNKVDELLEEMKEYSGWAYQDEKSKDAIAPELEGEGTQARLHP